MIICHHIDKGTISYWLKIQLAYFLFVIIIFINYIGCVTKIRTNFNLNFPLYCASARNCCWRPKMAPNASSKQSYSQNDCDIETKCGV